MGETPCTTSTPGSGTAPVDEQRRPVAWSEGARRVTKLVVEIGHSQGLPMKFDAGGALESVC